MRSLAKELALSLPDALKINRGKMSLPDVLLRARALGAQRVLIVGRGLMGNPGRLEVFETLVPPIISLALKLSGVRLARELGVRPQPPRKLAVVVQPTRDAVEFGHELATAMNLPLMEHAELGGVELMYDSLLYVEYVGRPRALFALKFLDPRAETARGPRLLVEKHAVIRRDSLRGYDHGQGR